MKRDPERPLAAMEPAVVADGDVDAPIAREERAPRAERAPREARAPREERAPREDRAPQEERAERPEQSREPRREREPRRDDNRREHRAPKAASNESVQGFGDSMPAFLKPKS